MKGFIELTNVKTQAAQLVNCAAIKKVIGLPATEGVRIVFIGSSTDDPDVEEFSESYRAVRARIEAALTPNR